MSTRRAPAASPATRPTSRRCTRSGAALGCTDCHGGDAAAARATVGRRRARRASTRCKARAHVAAAPRHLADVRRNPAGVWYRTARRVARVHPVRESRRPARRRHRRCGAAATPKEVRDVPQEHDDARRHALGRGALQQRRVSRSRTPQFGEGYSTRRHAARIAITIPPPTPRGDRNEGRAAVPRAAAPLRDHPAGQHPAHLRARRPASARGRAIPSRTKSRAARRTG